MRADRLEFLIRNRQPSKTPILAEAPTPKGKDPVVLRLYDPIDSYGGPYGVSAKEFSDALDSLPDGTEQIHLHINSPGGDSFDGLAILNALRQHPANVTVVVDGLAASAASFIAMGADEVVMAPNSTMMIHDASGLCYGQAAEMREMADLLDKVSGNIAAIYAGKAGGTQEQWREAMQGETWYTAEEAVAAGLADRILEGDAPEQPTSRFDLSVFNYAGRENAPAPQAPAPPSATGFTNTTAMEAEMSLSDALRERLGIADENADEDTILAALDEALNEHADPPTPEPAVSAEALAEVTRLSTELAELKTAAAKREKDEIFASWLRDGKTSPAERTQLEAMYDAAPAQTKALVDARAKGSVVPVNELGLVGEELTEDDAIYNELFGKKVG